MCSWLAVNKLTLNIYYLTSTLYFHPNIKMIDNNSNTSQPLEMKDYIRYLGILIDSNLSWKFHIDYICQKVSRRSRSGKLNKLHVGFCFFSSSLTLPCCFRIVWHSFQPQTTQMNKMSISTTCTRALQ